MTVCAVGPGGSPAAVVGVSGAAQQKFTVGGVGDVHIGEDEGGFGIGGVEHTAVFCGKAAAHHFKGAVADLRVAGHALVEDHVPGAVILLQIAHVS